MARGDHIMVKRWHGLYYHHGIDMGDDTVVHFSGEPLRRRDARVCRIPMETFLRDGAKIVVNYQDGIELLSPEETAQLAEEQLEQAGYSLFRNNCEHFARYCKTGKPYSEQVVHYVRVGAMIVMVGVAAVGAAVGSKVLGKISPGRRA